MTLEERKKQLLQIVNSIPIEDEDERLNDAQNAEERDVILNHIRDERWKIFRKEFPTEYQEWIDLTKEMNK